MEIIPPSVQQQPSSIDCRVFAIAFAFDNLNGFAEIGKSFEVGKMKLHLLKSLEEVEFTLFLRSHKNIKLSKGHIFT